MYFCTGSPREYLEHYVFPWLLPALEDMLRQAKKEKCLEVGLYNKVMMNILREEVKLRSL